MANRRVVLVRYCKTDTGWKRYPVVMGKSGRVRPNLVLVDGRERTFEEGHYELRYYRGSAVVYKPAGDDPTEALTARNRLADTLAAQQMAEGVGLTLKVETPERKSLSTWAERFLKSKELETHRSSDSLDGYKLLIGEFLKGCAKNFPDQLEADDIKFYGQTVEKKLGLSPRTRANRFSGLCTFLKYAKVNIDLILNKEDKKKLSKFTKTNPEVYTPDQINRLLEACRPKENYRLIFKTLWLTGLRMQELMYMEWRNVDLDQGIMAVKVKVGFEPKDNEDRDVPIREDLVEELRAWRMKNPTRRLVFGTASDRPNDKWLYALKSIAKKAGLNCGECDTCIEKEECERFFLHKFRASFITERLEEGMPLQNVMALSGHSDLKSVLRYMHKANVQALRLAIDSKFRDRNVSPRTT